MRIGRVCCIGSAASWSKTQHTSSARICYRFMIFMSSTTRHSSRSSLVFRLTVSLSTISGIKSDIPVPVTDNRPSEASIYQVRRHFQAWVPENLKTRLRPGATDLDDDVDWVYATTTPRYEYCIYVDDVCLESLYQPGPNFPVVKLLCKTWESPFPPEEMGDYLVPAPFHDGVTTDWEEDVGWMYLPVVEYLYKYYLLLKTSWDEQYARPPFIDGYEDESNFVGHWRRE